MYFNLLWDIVAFGNSKKISRIIMHLKRKKLTRILFEIFFVSV